ncbi:MAG: peptidylprolyl isomerase [Tenericutes bacterium]|nr:peptidylprolyl isomerase [Mycoplasmatota bacterium]
MATGCNTKDLNYIEGDNNGIKYYEIENNKYIESEEETNLVKLEVLEYGIVIIQLYPDIAPITVNNFKKLVKENFYDNLVFHRVIKDFVIQSGDPTATGGGGSEETIKGEFEINGVTNSLSHTRGVISMARIGADPETEDTMNSASSQFFIVHKDSQFLDGKYAAFGKVINGLDLVDNIASSATDSNDKPINDKIIKTITFVSLYEGE